MCGLVRDSYLMAETQEKYAVASYWRSPVDAKRFQKLSNCLALLENIRDYDERRRENILKLDQFVLIGSQNDGLISPWQSQFFGWLGQQDINGAS